MLNKLMVLGTRIVSVRSTDTGTQYTIYAKTWYTRGKFKWMHTVMSSLKSKSSKAKFQRRISVA